jgi:hypothetical protein
MGFAAADSVYMYMLSLTEQTKGTHRVNECTYVVCVASQITDLQYKVSVATMHSP